MKLLTYQKDGSQAVGVLSADGASVYPLSQFGFSAPSMQELIEGMTDDSFSTLKRALSQGRAEIAYPYGKLGKCAPIPLAHRDMICIGFNFRGHAEEIARLRGDPIASANVSKPIYFCKRIAHATGDQAPIPYIPGYAENLDVGVEVCVIIKDDTLNIPPEAAADHIFGYTITNDVCDTRINRIYTQPFLGKSLDGYMPVGPWIVTADEFDRDPLFDLKLTVNGKCRQAGNTADLVFSIPYIVSELSQNMTLKAGTMIATGSPANFDAGDPEKLLLLPGDLIRCEVSGIGTLVNIVEERCAQ